MSYTRREIGKMALASLAVPGVLSRTLAAQIKDARFNGVTLGAQTYSFRSINNPATRIIDAMKTIGLWEAELMSGDAENLAGMPALPNVGRGGRGQQMTPEQQAQIKEAQDAQRKWRLSTSPATWAAVKKQWNDAGIDVRFLCYNMNQNTADDMIEYGFQMAKALGVRAITTSTQVSMAKRIAPFADKHNVLVGVHGHASVENANEISTEATFLQCFEASKNIWANLDIGHYTATDADPIAFIQKHHGRITNLHVKDRKNKKNGMANLPFGQGDTNIKGVLQLLKTQKYDIPANIEFEYEGDPLVEMPKCLQYMKDALA
ncbi:MAG: sugar phosphate isomerase/epimerase [Acidobacteria bacterium]|nr:sugar phosphate isomerase/epimerase [Acidobacteriota bacterium]